MQFSFPPPPPGYEFAVAIRYLLVAWALIGLGILAIRLSRWKFIRHQEMTFWFIAAGISGLVAHFGGCRYDLWGINDWLVPATTAAISVSIAGIVIGLSKLYSERAISKMRGGLVMLGAIVVCSGFVVLSWGVSEYRWTGDRMQCRNNLKSIGLAMHNYHDVYLTFPAVASGEPPVSWRVSILPFIENSSIFKQYDQHSRWDRPPNDKLGRHQISILSCPADYMPRDTQDRFFTAYSMPSGPGSIGQIPQGTTIKDILDGTSNTLLIVEACGSQIVWTEPRDVDVVTQPTGINLNGSKSGDSAGWLSSYHRGGTFVAFADGHVKFLSDKTDPTVLKKMATIDGGEKLDVDDD